MLHRRLLGQRSSGEHPARLLSLPRGPSRRESVCPPRLGCVLLMGIIGCESLHSAGESWVLASVATVSCVRPASPPERTSWCSLKSVSVENRFRLSRVRLSPVPFLFSSSWSPFFRRWLGSSPAFVGVWHFFPHLFSVERSFRRLGFFDGEGGGRFFRFGDLF